MAEQYPAVTVCVSPPVSIWSAASPAALDAARLPCRIRRLRDSCGLVLALLERAGMRIKKSHLLFLAILLASALSWYVGAAELEPQLVSLASQPHVNTAFRDPDTGKSDALMALISFSVLAPVAVFVAIMLVLFVVRFVETLLVSVHAPAWPSTPLVGIGLVAALYTTSPSWIPPSLYTLGMVARAYFVYCCGGALPAGQ
jgi:hypothetical protein